jgi:RNA methyltransferase, TrmH family
MLIKQKGKYIQSLGQKKFRDAEKCFIAEGPKLVKDLLLADPGSVREIFGTAGWLEENEDWIDQSKLKLVTPEELERISQLITPNKVLAIMEQYNWEEVGNLKNKLTLVLDNIQDPGNFGTIIRIADWFGVSMIIAGPDSADVYNPKVVQSTMGSICRVPVHYLDLHSWFALQKDVPVYAAALNGENVSNMKKIPEGIIIIGNESKGISTEILQHADLKITIPKKGKAESLNAAVATGIILSALT